jgi:hypothetical protein
MLAAVVEEAEGADLGAAAKALAPIMHTIRTAGKMLCFAILQLLSS